MTKAIAKTVGMKAVAMSELLATDDGVKKAVLSIAKRGKALQRDIHVVACSILQRISVNNDVRLAGDVNSLIDAMPASMRLNALRDWFAAYGPIKWEGKKPTFVKDKPVELTKAMADPFWLFAPEAEYKPVDVVALINSVIKKLSTDTDKTGVDHSALKIALEDARNATGVKA